MMFTALKGAFTLRHGNLITTKWSVSSLTVESDKYSHDGMKVRAIVEIAAGAFVIQ